MIAQVAFDNPAEAFGFVLPAAVGVSIVLGTVPPVFCARAVLAILALIQLGPAAEAPGFD